MTNITIKAIYDNGGETFDRYTVVTNDEFRTAQGWMHECLGLSENPTAPQGFSQWSYCHNGKHLGKRIELENLPPEIQKHINDRLTEYMEV